MEAQRKAAPRLTGSQPQQQQQQQQQQHGSQDTPAPKAQRFPKRGQAKAKAAADAES
jgi:hypothetical protein